MKTRILRLLNVLRIVRLETIDHWQEVSEESRRGHNDVRHRNTRDIPIFLKSGLDPQTINATLFDGRQRRAS